MNIDINDFTSPKLWNLDLDSLKEVKAFLKDFKYPWVALNEIANFVEDLINKYKDSEDYYFYNDKVLAHKSSQISKQALIEGPAFISKDVIIGPNVYIREAVYLGKATSIHNSIEIKNAILLEHVEASHFNYIGDSILGNQAHLGAGAIISNLRHDKESVKIHLSSKQTIDTGLIKFGALLADRAEVGANAVLNPGTIVGKDSVIYPLTQSRSVIPSKHILKNDGKLYIIY